MAHKVHYPSLEIGWLIRRHKQEPRVEIIFTELENYSGFACNPRPHPWCCDDIGIDAGRCVLLMANPTRDDEMFFLNMLAHEFRHHWQRSRMKTEPVRGNFMDYDTYQAEIVRYFRSSKSEMDALLYSIDVAPDPAALEWLSWIRAGEASKECVNYEGARI